MNILMISNLYPNSEEPNRGIFTKQLVRAMRKTDRVQVMSPLPWFPQWSVLSRFPRWHRFARIPAEVPVDGHIVYYPRYLVIPKLFGFLQTVTMFFSLYPKVRRMHRREPIDVINAQWVYPDGVAAVWIGKLLKIPVVVSALGCDINIYGTRAYRLRRVQIAAALKSAEAGVAVSQALLDVMADDLSAPRKKLSVVLNGVDQDMFRPMDREESARALSLIPDRRRIVYVGRLSEEKGVETLVEATALLKKSAPDIPFQVVIVGGGALDAPCRSRAAELGLGDSIFFAGEAKHADIPRWMASAHVFCLPSYTEGCPNVVLEALSCGRGVVASRVGSLPQVISDLNGILVTPRDPAALAEGMRRGLEKKWDVEVLRGTMKDFTWDAAAGRYADIFRRAMDEKGST